MLDQDQAPVQSPGHHDRSGIAQKVNNRAVDQRRFGQRHRPQPRTQVRGHTGGVRHRTQQPIARRQGQLNVRVRSLWAAHADHLHPAAGVWHCRRMEISQDLTLV